MKPTVWGDGHGLDDSVATYTAGDDRRWDRRLLRWDVIGSMGHVAGLGTAGLLTATEHAALQTALRAALADADAGRFTLGDDDEEIDPFGFPFELEIESVIGVYATIGDQFRLRGGFSLWDTRYTDQTFGISDSDTVFTLDFGLGFNINIGNNLNLFGDYTFYFGSADYDSFFSSNVDFESTSVSFGLGFVF